MYIKSNSQHMPESKLVEEIANEILERLDDTFQSYNKDLVGVEWRIKEIESLLRIGAAGVYILGIWGIGGIGKTTIADAVFNKISRHFEGSYFAQNVREAEETGGIKDLQNELLSDGTEKIKGIFLDMNKVTREIHMNFYAFSKMPNLRFLRMYGDENKCLVSHLEGVPFAEVRHLEWARCPLKTLNICAEKLVSLKMPRSKVQQLWDDVQDLVNLKEIDLSRSESLTKLPDLSRAKNLEILWLRGCLSLVETHSSIQYLNKLEGLDLDYCISLTSLPTSIHSKHLKELSLRGCSNLKIFPEITSCHMWRLELTKVGIKELPSSIECLSNLQYLYIWDCSELESISSSIFKLNSLESIDISNCSNLKRFLEIPSCNIDGGTGIEQLASCNLVLEKRSSLESLPSSLCMFKSLTSLEIVDCQNFKRLPDELGNLEALEVLKVNGTAIREVPESLGRLSSLKRLVLSNYNLERLPESLNQLSSLKYLRLFENSLEGIPEYLRSLPSKLTSLNLSVDLRNCLKLDPNELSEIVKDGWMKQSFDGNIGIAKSFAFCIVVPHCWEPCETHEVFCGLKHKSQRNLDRRSLGRISYVESDHVFLGSYLLGYEDLSKRDDEVSFYISTIYGDDVEVKQCGIHFVYAQDSTESREEEEEDLLRYLL
ncbi:hypothetical protein CUMW_277990 [Citrus unshiu]|uniref:Uncharacterized protein n=1 Tax=Citrus unshiu TaxID=55188 RepID=A0A2H5N5L5_CITUN|nr:hypothetical protein CUMW_277990 [Citrus unshiu]